MKEAPSATVLVALSLVPGVGRSTARKALAATASYAPDDLEAAVLAARRRGPALPRGFFGAATASAESVLLRCRDMGVAVLRRGDAGWPADCDDLADPPELLYVLGSPAALARRSCAVVGTRKPSWYGEQSARRIAVRCAEHGIATVSGLALGIDAAAHAGSIEAGGATAAVLPWGVDRVVPAANGQLAERILSSGGALVSEMPPGMPGDPTPFSFIDRDRLQPALGALGLVLVESSEEGGAMHAVRQAKAMGRRIAAVVHPGGAAGSTANRSLVDAGTAVPLASKDDLAKWLGATDAD